MAGKRRNPKKQKPRKKGGGRPGARAKASASNNLGTENWLHSYAERETRNIRKRLDADLAKPPLLDFLVVHFGSLLFNAAQKLIDRRNQTGEDRAKDTAVIFSFSRLYNEFFAGNTLARNGLVLQATVLLRSAFEVASQSIMFMEHEDMAQRWLAGKHIPPKVVRRKSSYAAANKDRYDDLSGLSHANIEAASYHVVAVRGKRQDALAYGGWYLPKIAGQTIIEFLSLLLDVLEAFYETYAQDLDEQGLLWRGDAQTDPEFEGKPPLTWAKLLGIWRTSLTKLQDEYAAKPDDSAEMSRHFSQILSRM